MRHRKLQENFVVVVLLFSGRVQPTNSFRNIINKYIEYMLLNKKQWDQSISSPNKLFVYSCLHVPHIKMQPLLSVFIEVLI